jgi:hypothetical protein
MMYLFSSHAKLHKQPPQCALLSLVWESITSKYIIMMHMPGIDNPAEILSKHLTYQASISNTEANTLLFGKYSWPYSRRWILNDDLFFRYPMWDYLFCILYVFVKSLRWWVVTRFAQPHIHTYMFCLCVISTLYHLLEELQMRTFKRYFSDANLLTTLNVREMN